MHIIQIEENMTEQKNIKDNEQEKLHVEYNKVRWLIMHSIP